MLLYFITGNKNKNRPKLVIQQKEINGF